MTWNLKLMTFPRIGFRWIVTLCRCRRQFISINQSIFGTHRNSAALNKQWKSTRLSVRASSSSCTVARAVGVAAVIIINYLSSLRFSLENNNSPALTCENGIRKRHRSFVRWGEKRLAIRWSGMGHILSCFLRAFLTRPSSWHYFLPALPRGFREWKIS